MVLHVVWVTNMWFCLLLLGNVLSAPVDEFRSFVYEGELALNDDNFLKQIIPSGYSPQIVGDNTFYLCSNLVDENNAHYKTFRTMYENGSTSKGLIFNIYDDDMRNAAVALFRLLRDTIINKRENYHKLKKCFKETVNSDMLDYATRLTALYTEIGKGVKENFQPPFIVKPNYFVNGETIMKALYVSQNLGKINKEIIEHYQIHFVHKNIILINTNYSMWNDINMCENTIRYFMEDVSLNSYYYGVHLMHPYWMSNEELDEINPRHAEHYHFTHRQLYARYFLEKKHLGLNETDEPSSCDADFHPYLYYENGLAFPARSSILGNIRPDLAYLKYIDITIRECIGRATIIQNGSFVKVTDDNYIDLITKLIRANLESVKAAKVIRSVFGYGNDGYPIDGYNPSPSVLHHAQTSLREPVYWFLIRRALDYTEEYSNITEPCDISKYETDEFNITGKHFSKIATTFEYYVVNLNKAIENEKPANLGQISPLIFARQRRLNYLPFHLNFTVESKFEKDAIIRIFIGPQCDFEYCWDIYMRFFQLDSYRIRLQQGINNIAWTPEPFDPEMPSMAFDKWWTHETVEDNYNIFEFPKNLIIPKGLEKGLNLTLFVIITAAEEETNQSFSTPYNKIYKHVDKKPLGFPFHRQSKLYKDSASNYRFYNITIFHKKKKVDETGYFSPYLY